MEAISLMIISIMTCVVECMDGTVRYNSLLFLVFSNVIIYCLNLLSMTNKQAIVALIITVFFIFISLKSNHKPMLQRKLKALYQAIAVLCLSVLLCIINNEFMTINCIKLLLYTGISYHIFLIYSIIHRVQQNSYK